MNPNKFVDLAARMYASAVEAGQKWAAAQESTPPRAKITEIFAPNTLEGATTFSGAGSQSEATTAAQWAGGPEK